MGLHYLALALVLLLPPGVGSCYEKCQDDASCVPSTSVAEDACTRCGDGYYFSKADSSCAADDPDLLDFHFHTDTKTWRNGKGETCTALCKTPGIVGPEIIIGSCLGGALTFAFVIIFFECKRSKHPSKYKQDLDVVATTEYLRGKIKKHKTTAAEAKSREINRSMEAEEARAQFKESHMRTERDWDGDRTQHAEALADTSQSVGSATVQHGDAVLPLGLAKELQGDRAETGESRITEPNLVTTHPSGINWEGESAPAITAVTTSAKQQQSGKKTAENMTVQDA